ncbi:hypothetical protein AMELA_G00037050 [Ameiurus melas]|uniref:Uncharacterized protein n=1 Tax=Ameiurus melas TaxID=219545 RepID=A0A7J6B8R2_AMEME|nr:hypothetical protein AMELA_G00037050 [Ameiurus melas]
MNVKILSLVIVLLLSLLCSARAGPVTSTEHSKELEETLRLEEEAPSTPSVPQGAHAILDQGTASSAHPFGSDFNALPLS